MPDRAFWTAWGDWTVIHATGTPHIPRITWENCAATRRSTIRTAADGLSDEHSPLTAPTSPGPVRFSARPSPENRSEPPRPACVRLTPNVVAPVGTSSAATQNAATTDPAVRLAPRGRARRPG